jgi:hypothetical protein
VSNRRVKEGSPPKQRAQNNSTNAAQARITRLFSRVVKHIENYFDYLTLPTRYQRQLDQIKSDTNMFFRSCCDPSDVFYTAAVINFTRDSRAKTEKTKVEKKYESMRATVSKDQTKNFASYLMGCKNEEVAHFTKKATFFLNDQRYDHEIYSAARDMLRKVLKLLKSKKEFPSQKLEGACSGALKELQGDIKGILESPSSNIGQIFQISNPLACYNQAMLQIFEFAEKEPKDKVTLQNFLDSAEKNLENGAAHLSDSLISNQTETALVTMINCFKLIKNDENNLCTILFAVLLVKEITKKTTSQKILKAADAYFPIANKQIDSINKAMQDSLSNDATGTNG